MAFQSTVRFDTAFGVPGEIIVDGLRRVETGFLKSANPAYNIVGATVYTRPVGGGPVAAGGAIGTTRVFAGILCNPKTYASLGNVTGGGPLAPTMTLPNDINAELCITTSGMVVFVGHACNIGDQLVYDTTTGAINTIAPGATPAAGTALVPNATIGRNPQTTATGGVALAILANS